MKWMTEMTKHMASVQPHLSPPVTDTARSPGTLTHQGTILLVATHPAHMPTDATGTGNSIDLPSRD